MGYWLMFAYSFFNAVTAPIFTLRHFSVSKMYNFVLLPLPSICPNPYPHSIPSQGRPWCRACLWSRCARRVSCGGCRNEVFAFDFSICFCIISNLVAFLFMRFECNPSIADSQA